MKRNLLTTVKIAAATGVPRATLQHWIKTAKISAPAVRLVDGKAVRLWTSKQIREVQKLKGALRRGPKGPRKKQKKALPRGPASAN